MKATIKIIGIDNLYKMNQKTLENDINNRNVKSFESKCQVLHMYSNDKDKTVSAIVDVSADIYKHIKESESKIFVGYPRCKVFHIINIKP